MSSSSRGDDGDSCDSGSAAGEGPSNEIHRKDKSDSQARLLPQKEFQFLLTVAHIPGLENSCSENVGYANAVLQCLACTKPLVELCFRTEILTEARPNENTLYNNFRSYIRRSHVCRRQFLSLQWVRSQNLFECLGLVYGAQEDAHEFSIKLLGHFTDSRNSSDAAEWLRMFFTTSLVQNSCSQSCGKEFHTSENLTSILSLPCSSHHKAIEESLKAYFDHESLDVCGINGCVGQRRKGALLVKAPKVLVLHLSRCEFREGQCVKNCHYVRFDNTLSLNQYTIMQSCSEHALYALVVHQSTSASYGHYVAFVKVLVRGVPKWFRMDDRDQTEVEEQFVLKQQAYMLFYIQRESPFRQEESIPSVLEAQFAVEAPARSLETLIDNFIADSKDLQGDGARLPERSDIQKWCGDERLAHICSKAREHKCWRNVRDSQRLAVAVMLDSFRQTRNLVLQMFTGEGKSCVLAMLAAAICLEKDGDGELQVDIVTSNPVLAKRDCAEWRGLYESLGLRVSHNCGQEGLSVPYGAHVVYGTLASFAGDCLRTEFSKLPVRKTRPYRVVLVDELDYLLLDQGVQMTYLTDFAPGLVHLQSIFAILWMQSCLYRPCLASDGTVFFYSIEEAEEDIDDEPDEVGFDCDQSGTQGHFFVNCWQASGNSLQLRATKVRDDDGASENLNLLWIPNEQEQERGGRYAVLFLRHQLVEELVEMAKKVITTHEPSADEQSPKVVIPQYLREFVLSQLNTYASSALEALCMCEDRDYVVLDRKVCPVDRATGVTEKRMQWCDGLHQFLELKHGLPVSMPSFTTNFVSNITYIKKYNCILGVTGTVGAREDVDFLAQNFNNLAPCCLPPLSQRQVEGEGQTELSKCSTIVPNTEMWLAEIKEDVVRHERVTTLILCTDIATVKNLACHLIGRLSSQFEVLEYSRSDADCDVLERTFNGGEVIVATNLASRGTDIKVSDGVNANGGLRVILSFLPLSRRMQAQAFGRTGRQGNRGSVRMIFNNNDLNSHDFCISQATPDFADVLIQRDQCHKAISTKRSKCLEQLQKKEFLFQNFCQTFRAGEVKKDPYAAALCETWAMWLQRRMSEKDFETRANEDLWSDLKVEVEAQLLTLKGAASGNQGTAPQNPYQAVKISIDYQDGKYSDDELANVASSRCLLDYAISCEPLWKAVPVYMKAGLIIENKDENYPVTAIELLQSALEDVERYVSCFQSVQAAGGVLGSFESKESSNDQFQTRIDILTCFKDHCHENIKLLQSLREKQLKGQKFDSVVTFRSPDRLNKDPKKSNDVLVQGEINTFSQNFGLLRLFLVIEILVKPPFSWDALGCFFIGLGQILAGVGVAVVTAGVCINLAIGLITEGISDLAAGIEGMVTGAFDWAQWAIQKAISLAISLVCWGISKLSKIGQAAWRAAKEGFKAGGVKAALKAGGAVAKGAVRGGCQAAAQRVAITSTAVHATQAHVRKVVFKEIGKVVVKISARTIVDRAIDYGLSSALEHLRDKFLEHYQEQVEARLLRAREVCVLARACCGDWKYAIQEVEVSLSRDPSLRSQVVSCMDQISSKLNSPIIKGIVLLSRLEEVSQSVARALVLYDQFIDYLEKKTMAFSGKATTESSELEAVRSQATTCIVNLVHSIITGGIMTHAKVLGKHAVGRIGAKYCHTKIKQLFSIEKQTVRLKSIGNIQACKWMVDRASKGVQSPTDPFSKAAADGIRSGERMGMIGAHALGRANNIQIEIYDPDGNLMCLVGSEGSERVAQVVFDGKDHYSRRDGQDLLPQVNEFDCLTHAVAGCVGEEVDTLRCRTADLVEACDREVGQQFRREQTEADALLRQVNILGGKKKELKKKEEVSAHTAPPIVDARGVVEREDHPTSKATEKLKKPAIEELVSDPFQKKAQNLLFGDGNFTIVNGSKIRLDRQGSSACRAGGQNVFAIQPLEGDRKAVCGQVTVFFPTDRAQYDAFIDRFNKNHQGFQTSLKTRILESVVWSCNSKEFKTAQLDFKGWRAP